MGDIREPNGVVLEESQVTSSSGSRPGQGVWARAEGATQEIIKKVQPTAVSEERRRDVIDYVQRLLKGFLGCEVFPFGSVPLKTYLPDGDIDLTAFCGFNIEEAFAHDVSSVLQAEDRNPTAEFVVKDVQLIHAEVKLVKCLVQNIVVDISFNQIGGLCALCFLEEVDRLIGKDHLFKRSIILIKAWCYYESRILGAHHGLISTYALETLVLYIFHLFHVSLNGPLAVLHKFLDYFSKFDWDNFCVSLSGPIRLASLPELVAERPESSGGDLLLSDEFIRDCVTKFSVPSRGPETNYRTFMQKHLNIVDPLKENNNLGRSVSKGNFFRIRSAFSFGARKLGHILSQHQENVAEEVCKFFANTLDRHGKGQRPDVQDLFFGRNGLSSEMLLPVAESFRGQNHTELDSVHSNNPSSDGRVDSEYSVDVVVNNSEEPGTYLEGTVDEHKKGVKKSSTQKSSVSELSKEELSASARYLSEDAIDLVTDDIQDLRITEQGDETFPPVAKNRKLPVGDLAHGPRLYCPQPMEIGKLENGDLDEEPHTHPSVTHNIRAGGVSHQKANGFMYMRQNNSHLCNSNGLPVSRDSHLRHSPMSVDAHGVQDSHSVNHCYPAGSSGRHEPVSLLPDLSGDVDCHLQSLQYGHWWYDHGLTMPIQPLHLPPPPMFQTKGPWDAFRQPVQFRQEVVPQMNVNGVVPRPVFFPANPLVTHFVDEIPKARGIGTYFPITNHQSYRDRSSPRGRHQGQLKSPRNNGRGPTPIDRGPQMQNHIRQGVGRPRVPDSQEYSPRGKVYKEANGFMQASEKVVEYDSPRHSSPETSLQESENCRPQDADLPTGIQNGEPVFVVEDGRISVHSYRLKDEEDFPPLSG